MYLHIFRIHTILAIVYCQNQVQGMQSQDLRKELHRKSFHLLALFFPLIYIFISKLWMILTTLVCISLPIYIDISRHYNTKVQGLVNLFLTPFMRQGEENGNFKLSGVTYMMLGIGLTVILFSKSVAIISLMVLILADTNAALVGKRMGGMSFTNNKTLAGSIAFFMTAFMIALCAQVFFGLGLTFLAIIIASLFSAIVELFSKDIGVNDNLSIPLTYGLLLTVLSMV